MHVDTPQPSLDQRKPGELTEACRTCRLTPCVCDQIPSLPCRTRVLILQHPQEARDRRSTAWIAEKALPKAKRRVGLSWRNLAKAWGEPTDPKEWGVLFLGTKKSGETARVSPKGLKGIVVLDGNWKQSKTLWWRNPWLLKLTLLKLDPTAESGYAPVRKQPRKECLSTLEAVAECLTQVGDETARLKDLFTEHVERLSRL